MLYEAAEHVISRKRAKEKAPSNRIPDEDMAVPPFWIRLRTVLGSFSVRFPEAAPLARFKVDIGYSIVVCIARMQQFFILPEALQEQLSS